MYTGIISVRWQQKTLHTQVMRTITIHEKRSSLTRCTHDQRKGEQEGEDNSGGKKPNTSEIVIQQKVKPRGCSEKATPILTPHHVQTPNNTSRTTNNETSTRKKINEAVAKKSNQQWGR